MVKNAAPLLGRPTPQQKQNVLLLPSLLNISYRVAGLQKWDLPWLPMVFTSLPVLIHQVLIGSPIGSPVPANSEQQLSQSLLCLGQVYVQGLEQAET